MQKARHNSMLEHRWGCQGLNRAVIPNKNKVKSLSWGADVDFKLWYKLHSKCRLLALCDPLAGAGCNMFTLRIEAISLVNRAYVHSANFDAINFRISNKPCSLMKAAWAELLHLTGSRWCFTRSIVKIAYYVHIKWNSYAIKNRK